MTAVDEQGVFGLNLSEGIQEAAYQPLCATCFHVAMQAQRQSGWREFLARLPFCCRDLPER